MEQQTEVNPPERPVELKFSMKDRIVMTLVASLFFGGGGLMLYAGYRAMHAQPGWPFGLAGLASAFVAVGITKAYVGSAPVVAPGPDGAEPSAGRSKSA